MTVQPEAYNPSQRSSLRRRSSNAGSRDALLGELTLVEALGDSGGSLGHLSSRLRKVNLNVARAAAVGVDTTVGAVGATVGLRRPVDHDVADEDGLSVKALRVRVSLGVLQKIAEKLDRLDRPAALSPLELVGLGSPANTAVVAPERHTLLVLGHVVKVDKSLLKRHTAEGSSSLARVLVVHAEVRTLRTGRLLGQLGVVKSVTSLRLASLVQRSARHCIADTAQHHAQPPNVPSGSATKS